MEVRFMLVQNLVDVIALRFSLTLRDIADGLDIRLFISDLEDALGPVGETDEVLPAHQKRHNQPPV